jgi:hypothetical protein
VLAAWSVPSSSVAFRPRTFSAGLMISASGRPTGWSRAIWLVLESHDMVRTAVTGSPRSVLFGLCDASRAEAEEAVPRRGVNVDG